MIGKLLQLQPGFVVAIWANANDGYFGIVVANVNPECKAYPVGGHGIFVDFEQAHTAPKVNLAALMGLAS